MIILLYFMTSQLHRFGSDGHWQENQTNSYEFWQRLW